MTEFKFSRFCKETIATSAFASEKNMFKFSRFCKETIAAVDAYWEIVDEILKVGE